MRWEAPSRTRCLTCTSPRGCGRRCATFKTQESTGGERGNQRLAPSCRAAMCLSGTYEPPICGFWRRGTIRQDHGNGTRQSCNLAPPHSNGGEHMSSLKWHDNTALMARISVSQTAISQDDSDDLSPPRKTLPSRSTPARLLGTTSVLPLRHLDACLLQRKRHPARRLR